jgi:hypothetical protein
MDILGLIGSILMLIGWIWLLVIAFKNGGILWVVLIFFFSLVAGLVYCIVKKTGWTQYAMILVGWLIVMYGVLWR